MLRNRLPFVSSLLLLSSSYAHATFINDGGSGLTSPEATLNFASPVLSTDDIVTDQFAWVTFSPNVYFEPESGFGIMPNTLGNFTYATEPAYVDPVTITIGRNQSGAAFQMAAEYTPYAFTALLNGVVVDSATTAVSDVAGFYGFTGEPWFNQLVIAEAGVGGGPYWVLGNVELSSIPEPSTWAMMLAGFAGLGYAGYRRAKGGRAALAA
jgi:hypothetical protein